MHIDERDGVKQSAAIATVFALAVLMRLSSCYESFWVDELHTVWAASGDFGDVGPRAAMGNQMPVYFWSVWGWLQLVGDGEFGLRLTSVLAVAIAAAWLFVVVHRETGSAISGALSGGVVAVEANSLWFGTELRPYAAIMLVATFAFGATLRLMKDERGDRLRQQLVLTACLIAGVLLQPTSLGVLLWMPVFLIARSMWQRRSWWPRFGIGVVGQVITLIAVLLWAWRFTLQSSWQLKDNWASFAVPTWIGPYWTIWPWWTLVIVPLVLAALCWWFLRFREGLNAGSSGGRLLAIGMGLGVAAMAITFAYWAIAYLEWVPLWHRRYFIAVLPIIAAVPGFAAATVPRRVTVFFSVGVLVALMSLQNTWPDMNNPSSSQVQRNEAWREAIAWLGDQVSDHERVYLDAGLIEARRLDDGSDDQDLIDYLAFPIRGPYGTPSLRDRTSPIARSLLLPLDVLGSPESSDDRVWVVSRRSMRSMRSALKRSIRRSGPFDYAAVRLTSFGNVTIAELPRLKKPQRRGWFGF